MSWTGKYERIQTQQIQVFLQLIHNEGPATIMSSCGLLCIVVLVPVKPVFILLSTTVDRNYPRAPTNSFPAEPHPTPGIDPVPPTPRASWFPASPTWITRFQERHLHIWSRLPSGCKSFYDRTWSIPEVSPWPLYLCLDHSHMVCVRLMSCLLESGQTRINQQFISGYEWLSSSWNPRSISILLINRVFTEIK